jgi:ribosome biogenesis GTPase
MDPKKQKIRTELRKKHDSRKRSRNLTRQYAPLSPDQDGAPQCERVSGKGELTRKRTVIGQQAAADETGVSVRLHIDQSSRQEGRVLTVHGLTSTVRTEDGQLYQCATRRLLKNLNTDQRNVIAAGDRVLFRIGHGRQGVVERVEPRRGVLSRTSRGRQQVIVANVDQLIIIASAAEPRLKPNLIDRFLVTAERADIRPVVCINKIDLVDPADLQPLAGVYGQMGYEVLLLSARTGFGLERLKRILSGGESVMAGQSGVGKSSLLNAIEPQLKLPVRDVSPDTQKGRHTTSTAQLLPLSQGGFVVDTPGVRQFQLWDVVPAEVAGFYRDLRPYVSLCRFPDCTHTHEARCAVKDAVADGRLDARRYESYRQLLAGDAV